MQNCSFPAHEKNIAQNLVNREEYRQKLSLSRLITSLGCFGLEDLFTC